MSSQWEDAHPDPPCAHGLTGGRGAAERCLECGASVTAASPDERLREENERLHTMLGKVPLEQLARIMAATNREKPDKPHTQDCQDAMFMHHAATGGDMECTCRPPVSDDPTGITRPTPEPDRRARFGRIAPHVSDDPVNDPETNT